MKKIIFLLLNVCFVSLIFAQPKGEPIILGESFSISSKILKEDRPYLVYLPENYNVEGNPISVLYLLDGDGHFHHTTGVVAYMTQRGLIPPMMVVAIPNTTDRTRDLTPAIERDDRGKVNMPTAGGADNMLAFIKKELIPHIEKEYHTNSYRMLVGHSFGGLFAVHSFLSEPNLFDSYIAISPSMWWDDQNLVHKAETFLEKKPQVEGFFYMTMGNEGGAMLGGGMKLAALFEEHPLVNFDWDFKVMEKETHGTVPHRSTYDGLEAIFKELFSTDLGTVFETEGMEGLEKHYAKLSKVFGYEMKAGEDELNNLGYQLIQKGKKELAIEVFKKNVETYPNSYNAYDSMAEGYMNAGKNDLAIKHYTTSVEMHPGNLNGVRVLKQLGVDYDPMIRAISLSSSKRKQWEGTYSNDKVTFKVGIEGNKLMIWDEEGMLPKQEMIPFPKDRFLIQQINFPVLAKFDKKKNITGFEIQTGNTNYLHLNKVK